MNGHGVFFSMDTMTYVADNGRVDITLNLYSSTTEYTSKCLLSTCTITLDMPEVVRRVLTTRIKGDGNAS